MKRKGRQRVENIILEERNDARGSYLVAAGFGEGSYREEMLKNSNIEGLLPVTGQNFNGRHELWYETTARQALKLKYAQSAPGVEEITELLRQIGLLAQRLEEYLLEAEELVLELSRIFEKGKGEFLFLYLPGYEGKKQGGICGLLEELMEYVDYEDHRAVSFVYLLHAGSRQQSCGILSLQRLCEEISEAARAEEEVRRNDDFLEEFEASLDMKKEEGKKAWKEKTAGKRRGADKDGGERVRGAEKRREVGKGTGIWEIGGSAFAAEKASGQAAGGKGAVQAAKSVGGFRGFLQKLKGYVKTGLEENSSFHEEPEDHMVFGDSCTDTVLLSQEGLSDTVLLAGDPDTVLLREEERCTLEAVDQTRGDISIDSFPFCIGKEGKDGGYALREPVISRRHAEIIKDGMHYFLVDTKSLNGTYLNGERLVSGEKKEIKNGDRIDFADICFIFACCKVPNGI